MARYHLLLYLSNIPASFVVEHKDLCEKKCKCLRRIRLDYNPIFAVPNEAVPLVLAMGGDGFLGGTDAQNFIATEAMFLTIYAVATNGYESDNRPVSDTDTRPFTLQCV